MFRCFDVSSAMEYDLRFLVWSKHIDLLFFIFYIQREFVLIHFEYHNMI